MLYKCETNLGIQNVICYSDHVMQVLSCQMTPVIINFADTSQAGTSSL